MERIAIQNHSMVLSMLLLPGNMTDPFRGSLLWRYNGHHSVSNHPPHICLPNRLFWRRPNKTSKLRVTGLCAGNLPGSPHKWPATRKMFPFDDVIMMDESFALFPRIGAKYRNSRWIISFEFKGYANKERFIHHAHFTYNRHAITQPAEHHWKQGSWGQHGWAPCWPHELCYLGRLWCSMDGTYSTSLICNKVIAIYHY